MTNCVYDISAIYTVYDYRYVMWIVDYKVELTAVAVVGGVALAAFIILLILLIGRRLCTAVEPAVRRKPDDSHSGQLYFVSLVHLRVYRAVYFSLHTVQLV